MSLHLLVIEGDTRDDRDAYRAGLGMTASEAYAQTLMQLAPDAICQIGFPTDEGAGLPDAAGPGDHASDRSRPRRLRLAHAIVRLLLGLAGRDRRGGRRSAAQSQRPRDRRRPQDLADRGRPRASAARRPPRRL